MRDIKESRARGRIPFTVRLPDALVTRLKEYCLDNRMTLQDVAELVITEFLDREHPVSKPKKAAAPPPTAPATTDDDTRMSRIENSLERLAALLGEVVHREAPKETGTGSKHRHG